MSPPHRNKSGKSRRRCCSARTIPSQRRWQPRRPGQKQTRSWKFGRLIRSGTHRAREGIRPGTYAIEGDIADCYWEHTDSTGQLIDNYFTMGANRVQVTIASSDYSFTNQGCGLWRPAG